MTAILSKKQVRVSQSFLGRLFVQGWIAVSFCAFGLGPANAQETSAQQTSASQISAEDVFAPSSNRLQFSDKAGAALLAKLPFKKPVNLMTYGDSEDQSVGDQLQNFLAGHGYAIVRKRGTALSRQPASKLTVQETPASYFLTVVPSA